MEGKNNFFLKKLTETQFNIARRTRSTTFYTLDLLILQRELKLLLRLLRHAHNKTAKMFLKPDSNNSSEEILKELVESLKLQIGILSKENSIMSEPNKLTNIKNVSPKQRRISEPARVFFYLKNVALKRIRKYKKCILIILLLVLLNTLAS